MKIESEADAVAERLDSIGICFCFAAKLHPAMRHVVGVRRKLGVKTLFNLLGPLCNPAGATHQLLGTSTPDAQTKVAAAIGELGTTRSFVVHASDGQDEVALEGTTSVLDVLPQGQQQRIPGRRVILACSRPVTRPWPPRIPPRARRSFVGYSTVNRDRAATRCLAGTAAALLLVGRGQSLSGWCSDGAPRRSTAMRRRQKLAALRA